MSTPPTATPSTAPPSKPPMLWPVYLLVSVLSLVSLGLMFVVGLQVWQESHIHPKETVWVDDATKAGHDQASADIRAEFERYRDRTDNLQKLIAALIGLASLYTVVLAITGYINGQNYLKQLELSGNESLKQVNEKVDEAKAKLGDADTHLKEVKDQLDKAKTTSEDLQKKFNAFTHINENLNTLIERVSTELPDVEGVASIYQSLPSELREKIYFWEKSLAFAELISLESEGPLREGVARAFMTLGRFYRVRFLSEAAAVSFNFTDGSAQSSWTLEQRHIFGLLERAWMYGNMSVKIAPKNFPAWTNLGMTRIKLKIPGVDPIEAFDHSLELQDDQQKARYMKSIVQHGVQKKFMDAEVTLTQALARNVWEDKEISERRADLFYNRACARARLAIGSAAASEAQASFSKAAIEDLQKGCPTASEHGLKVFNDDCAAGGDLEQLASQHSADITVIRERLEGKRPSL